MLSSDDLKAFQRQLGEAPSVASRTLLEEKRQRITKRLRNFAKRSQPFMLTKDNADGNDSDEDPDSEMEEDEQQEMHQPQLPSNMKLDDQHSPAWIELGKMEVQLRIGQMHDSLENLRLALGKKAVLCRSVLRHATTTLANTRAHSLVKKVMVIIEKHVRCYRRARKAVVALDPNHILLQRMQKLEDADLRISADITEEQRYSQRSDKLPWIWQMPLSSNVANQGNQEWMNECELSASTTIHSQGADMVSLRYAGQLDACQGQVGSLGRRAHPCAE